MTRHLAAIIVACAFASACGSDGAGSSDSGGPTDGGSDSAAESASGSDSGSDSAAGSDSASDSGSDSGRDSASDSGSISDGGCSNDGGGGYATSFDLTENPISECGHWPVQGGLTGLDWTNVRTGGGLAFGTLTGLGGYEDSIALLSGFAANQRVTATVHFTSNRSAATGTHEVELILRGSYTAHVQHLYECNLGYAGATGWYSQIVRMNGAIGDFTDITTSVSPLPDIKDGDVFTAEIVGSVISTYVNGVKTTTATDATHATGQPGIGFFWRATEKIDDFAFTGLVATSL